MAEGGVSLRHEWHHLLIDLKSTTEGVLATPSSNVWSTYGGLDRLCKDVDKIMRHRLRVTQGPQGSSLDYWNFVRGIRCLNPVMSPYIDHIGRLVAKQSSKENVCGMSWVRQSLLNHNLSSQLRCLVSNKVHLAQHYYDEAFLWQEEYFRCFIICLQALEQNSVVLLAEVNPNLLTRRKIKKLAHARSASLPIVNQASESIMIRRTSINDRLAPPTLSPKTDSVLTLSDKHAIPSIGSSPDVSAKDALLQVLTKSGDSWEEGDYDFHSTDKLGDPLLNSYVIPAYEEVSRKRSLSHNNLNQVNNNNSRNRTDVVITVNTPSKSAQLLDSILNNDEISPTFDKRVSRCGFELPGNTQSQLSPGIQDRLIGNAATNCECESTSQSRKPSHTRSVSDFGVSQMRTMSPELVQAGLSSNDDRRLSSTLPRREKSYLEEESPLRKRRQNSTHFRQPAKGQSLLSFLSSQDFHTCADLDKENAHFSISEALIAAIEQMKWNQVIRPQQPLSDQEEGDSDDEIQQLKQRIRIRRRERMKEKARGFPAFSDGKTDITTTTNTSTTSPTTSSSIISSMSQDSSSSDDIEDTEITDLDNIQSQESNLMGLKQSGLSLSLGSLYSDAEIQRSNANLERSLNKKGAITESTNITVSQMSAESVAISLLKKFSEKQLPKASELEWLVSEQDAPQALLPLPDSYPVSPDDSENADLLRSQTRLRGNLEWAPPRNQIIFNIHPAPKRKVVLVKQNYRCAGCGAKVEPGYMKRYRYCDYLGKYFCPRCHTNDTAYIPGRILRKWDFAKYYVSNFARELLSRIYNDALFNVKDINISLYRKVRTLEQIRDCRCQLKHLKVFLQTCRNGQSMLEEINKYPQRWTEDVHLYSMSELIQVKKGDFLPVIKCLVNDSVGHVSQCQLCQAKGFFCELCNGTDIIFPFELHRVVQCDECRTCFHKICFVAGKCPKCTRIQARRLKLAQEEERCDSDS